jgi:hypothetical protein
MAKRNAAAERRARLEQVRREQRAKERRRTLLTVGGGGLLAVAILAIAIVPAVLDARAEARVQKVGYVRAATDPATEAGCTGVVNDRQVSRDHTDKPVTYQQRPPSSGPHSADPLPEVTRFYTRAQNPSEERAVHNLEHGFVLGWYDKELPADQVAALERYSRNASTRFIAIPWDREAFPDGKPFVLTAWDRTQRCEKVSPAVIDAFIERYADPSEGQDWDSPTAPESGGSGGSLTAPTGAATPPPTGTATPRPTGTATPRPTGTATPSPTG